MHRAGGARTGRDPPATEGPPGPAAYCAGRGSRTRARSASARDRGRDPEIEQRSGRVGVPVLCERPERLRGRSQQFLVTDVLRSERSRLENVALVEVAIRAEQTNGRRDLGLQILRRGLLKAGERRQRSFVANLPDRQNRVLLQRAIELRHRRNRRQRIIRPCNRQALRSPPLRNRSCPFITSPVSAARTFASLAVRGQCARQCRTDELRLLFAECVKQPVSHPRLAVLLEVRVGDRRGGDRSDRRERRPSRRGRRGSLNPDSSTSARNRT